MQTTQQWINLFVPPNNGQSVKTSDNNSAYYKRCCNNSKIRVVSFVSLKIASVGCFGLQAKFMENHHTGIVEYGTWQWPRTQHFLGQSHCPCNSCRAAHLARAFRHLRLAYKERPAVAAVCVCRTRFNCRCRRNSQFYQTTLLAMALTDLWFYFRAAPRASRQLPDPTDDADQSEAPAKKKTKWLSTDTMLIFSLVVAASANLAVLLWWWFGTCCASKTKTTQIDSSVFKVQKIRYFKKINNGF